MPIRPNQLPPSHDLIFKAEQLQVPLPGGDIIGRGIDLNMSGWSLFAILVCVTIVLVMRRIPARQTVRSRPRRNR